MFQLTILLPIKLLIKLGISYFLALVSLEDEFNSGVIAHTFDKLLSLILKIPDSICSYRVGSVQCSVVGENNWGSTRLIT